MPPQQAQQQGGTSNSQPSSGGGIPFPGQSQGQGSGLFILDQFDGLNTKPLRPAIGDQQFSWLENFLPIGPGNLRSLYGPGPAGYTAPVGRTIVNYVPYNIGTTQKIAVFLDNGTAQSFNIVGGLVTNITSTPGLIVSTGTTPTCAQWGSKWLIIVCNNSNAGASNGYFIWDGTVLFGPGGVSPVIVITNAGTKYLAPPLVTISGGSGVGATAVATVTNESVTSITVTNPGTGYLVGDTITVTIAPPGGGVTATATGRIMPFGAGGTCVEVFSSRVWIGNGPRITFSAPSDVTNFSTVAGGGSFEQTDSFLRNSIIAIRQANGFLYTFGDSSVNVISNVQTSGTPATTTFNNANVDPQMGTPWRDSIQAFGRALLYSNPSGIYALYGGSAEKISGELDGLFARANFSTGVTPTSAVMTIFGVKCYMLSLTTLNPFEADAEKPLLCMWNEQKWFLGSQDDDLKIVALQTINSDLNAFGSDNTTVYPLFELPSLTIPKRFQTKLWAGSAYIIYKKAFRLFWQIFNNTTGDFLDIDINVDSDITTVPLSLDAFGIINFINNSLQPLQFVNNFNQPIFFTVPDFAIDGQDVSAFGRLLGLTLESLSSDFTVVSMALMYQDNAPFGG